jgi:hypothetical protein
MSSHLLRHKAALQQRAATVRRLQALVYAQQGRELMGCPFDLAQGKGSPLYVNPVNALIRNSVQGPVSGLVSTCLRGSHRQAT